MEVDCIFVVEVQTSMDVRRRIHCSISRMYTRA